MGKIIWAPSTLKDINSRVEYIEKDSVDEAALFFFRIIEMNDQLKFFADSGRIIPEIKNENYCELIYRAYRIMYRTVKKEIWISGITHCP